MFEIYYIVPTKGDKSSKDDLLEYSLREVIDKHTLIHKSFSDIKDVICCIVESCIGYYTKTCYVSSRTYIKCPFVIRRDNQVIFDSNKDNSICTSYTYMASQKEMEFDVYMKLEKIIIVNLESYIQS